MCFIFGKGNFSHTPSATYTESARSVPTSDLRYTDITKTIQSYPHLFPIITLINADHLQQLLGCHPNSDLILSVCQGLRSGFWPFANTMSPESIPQGSVSRPHRALILNDMSHLFLKSHQATEMPLG